MMQLTPLGHKLMTAAMARSLRTVQPVNADGEPLTNWVANPITLDPAEWSNGTYPEVVWVLLPTRPDAQPEVIAGLLYREPDGAVVVSQLFTNPVVVRQAGQALKIIPELRAWAWMGGGVAT